MKVFLYLSALFIIIGGLVYLGMTHDDLTYKVTTYPYNQLPEAVEPERTDGGVHSCPRVDDPRHHYELHWWVRRQISGSSDINFFVAYCHLEDGPDVRHSWL